MLRVWGSSTIRLALALALVGCGPDLRVTKPPGTSQGAAPRPKSRSTKRWATPSIEHFRSAIENYRPVVSGGRRRALGSAIPSFARYLNGMHSRIHPIFADGFLDYLDRLPQAHPLNESTLAVTLELVIERQAGGLVRRGVVRTSGVTAFDISAIAAVERAAPFETPPPEILSSDGKVYVHWVYRRDQMACSTLHAHPFMLQLPSGKP